MVSKIECATLSVLHQPDTPKVKGDLVTLERSASASQTLTRSVVKTFTHTSPTLFLAITPSNSKYMYATDKEPGERMPAWL